MISLRQQVKWFKRRKDIYQLYIQHNNYSVVAKLIGRSPSLVRLLCIKYERERNYKKWDRLLNPTFSHLSKPIPIDLSQIYGKEYTFYPWNNL